MAANSMKEPSAVKIDRVLGKMVYLYYTYVKYFVIRPLDIDDLVDGLNFMSIQQEIKASEYKDKL